MAEGRVLSRALNGAEELWARAMELGTGISVQGFAIEGPVDRMKVEEAAAATAKEIPFLGAKVVKKGKDKYEYVLKEGPWAGAVTACPWPLAEGSHANQKDLSELHLIVERELNSQFAELEHGASVAEIHTYSQPNTTFLILRLYGSSFDRRSAVVVGETLLSNLDAAIAGHPSVKQPASLELPEPLLEMLPKDIKGKSFISKALDTVGYVRHAMKAALLPFEPGCSDHRKNHFHTEYVEVRLGTHVTKELVKACAQHNCSVFGMECAGMLSAVAKVKGLSNTREEFQLTSLTNVRALVEPPLGEKAVGSYTLGLPMCYNVNESTLFWEMARHFSTAAEENVAKQTIFKDMSVLDKLFSTVLSHPTITPEASLRTSLFSAMTDAPHSVNFTTKCIKILDFDGPCISMHGIGPCIAMGDNMQGGDLHLQLIYAAPLFSRAKISRIGEVLREVLVEAAKM